MSDLTIQLIDLSPMHRFGVQGAGAETWLAGQGVEVPHTILSVIAFGDGGRIARTGSHEFFLESTEDGSLAELESRLPCGGQGVYRVPREEATWMLSGRLAPDVMLQTCAIDFRAEQPDRLIYTRIAGVSCAILVEADALRIWLEPSYAHYLWHTIAEIVVAMSGTVSESRRLSGRTASH